MRPNYVDVPPEAPRPRMWKSLGHAMAGVEAHYHLRSWYAEFDDEFETNLLSEMMVLAEHLHNMGRLQGDDPIMLCRESTLIVRLCECTCGTNLWTTKN